jgi:hypothetical protein
LAPQATNGGENTTYPTRFHFVRMQTFAVSRWLDTGIDAPNYLEAIVDLDPDRPGTSVRFEWQGAHDDGNGNAGEERTDWVSSIDDIDRRRHYRFRAVLTADPIGGLVPAVRSLAIVYEFR